MYLFLFSILLLMFLYLKYSTIKYKIMVFFMDIKKLLKQNENNLVLHLNKTSLKLNTLLNFLNKNELIQELIYSNKIPTRFLYLFNITLKTLDRLINYILIYIKKK